MPERVLETVIIPDVLIPSDSTQLLVCKRSPDLRNRNRSNLLSDPQVGVCAGPAVHAM